MSEQLFAGGTPGVTVYFRGYDGSQLLNVNTLLLETIDLNSLSDYSIAASEVGGSGNSGAYIATIPEGTPAGDWVFQPYIQQDPAGPSTDDPLFAGPVNIHWNGNDATDDLGTDVDADIALVTLSEVKQYLNFTGAESDDILSSFINEVSAWVQNFVGRDLVAKDHTQYYSGDGDDELVLKDYPIVSVASIHQDSQRVFGSDTLIAASNYIVKKATGIIKAFYLLSGFYCGESNIKVVYNAGYTIGSSGTMPYEIRLAVKRIISRQFRLGYVQQKLDHQSLAEGNITTTFRDNDVPKDVEAMLIPYRRYVNSPHFSYAD